MTGLVERLRSNLYPHSIDHEAAAEIERLCAKVERLNVVVESRDAAVDCLEAEVATAYRQMNEAIDTAREAQAEVEALRAVIRDTVKLLDGDEKTLGLLATTDTYYEWHTDQRLNALREAAREGK